MKNRPISKSTGALMIATAAFFDILQFFCILLDFTVFLALLGEILSKFVTIIASIAFFIWLKVEGVDFLKVKASGSKGLSMPGVGFLGTFVVDMAPVPFVSALPTWTFIMWRIIRNTRKGALAEPKTG